MRQASVLAYLVGTALASTVNREFTLPQRHSGNIVTNYVYSQSLHTNISRREKFVIKKRLSETLNREQERCIRTFHVVVVRERQRK